MIITAQQMNAFEASAAQTFARRLADYFGTGFAGCRAHSGEVLPCADALDARVLELMDAARSFGLATELAVAQFVALGLGYAREFHRTPRVAEMLRAPELSPEQNIQRVLDAVIAAEALEA